MTAPGPLAPAPTTPEPAGPTDGAGRPARTLVVWCADWPVRAWGIPPDQPAAVLEANLVTACSPAARRSGVRVGLRRREAQARCPDLVLLTRDPALEARTFEPVVAAVARFTPFVEVGRPGVCALATRGPSRYFGGDEALAVAVADAVRAVPGAGDSCLGVADGTFAATWAARRAPRSRSGAPRSRPRAPRVARSASLPGVGPPGGPGLVSPTDEMGLVSPTDEAGSLVPVGTADGGERAGPLVTLVGTVDAAGPSIGLVPPGAGAAFLTPLPLGCLEAPELVEVLWQLGLRTLGDFAALPEADVLARFGTDAARRHRVARGREDRPLDARRPPPDLAVSLELDPPAERVDHAAFAAKTLADGLTGQLAERGLACTRLAVRAETCHGEVLLRLWRHDGVLGPAAMAERIRWQLEGWLAADLAAQPTGGLSRLHLAPDEVVPARGRQLGFWGGETQEAERAARAAARVAALVGSDGVVVPRRRGGRSAPEQFELVPVAGLDLTTRTPLPPPGPPWPGRLPLEPASMPDPPVPADVLTDEGQPVQVSGRGLASGPPARVDGAEVVAWAGPWPLEERWWDTAHARRQARIQVVLADGSARLLALEGGRWWCTGTHD